MAGLHHLLVVEPGTQRDALPAAIVNDLDDRLVVDIPPALHIHRYYYSGDLEFQGPIIQGGPTVIVANHPRTGERLYTEVTLPPGAPLVSYCSSSITYVYDDSRVSINYPRLHTDRVRVKYHSGRGAGRITGEVTDHVVGSVGETITKSSLMNTMHETLADGGQLVKGVACGMDTATSEIVKRAKAMLGVIPGVTALQGLGEDSPVRSYWSQIDHARLKKEKAEVEFVPTNR